MLIVATLSAWHTCRISRSIFNIKMLKSSWAIGQQTRLWLTSILSFGWTFPNKKNKSNSTDFYRGNVNNIFINAIHSISYEISKCVYVSSIHIHRKKNSPLLLKVIYIQILDALFTFSIVLTRYMLPKPHEYWLRTNERTKKSQTNVKIFLQDIHHTL